MSLLRRLLALLSGLLALSGTGAQAADPHFLSYPQLTPQPDTGAGTRGAGAGTLLFSDSPERPTRAGLLYRDTARGPVRVVAYHENGLGVPARVLLLAEPQAGADGAAPEARIQTLRRGAAQTPGPDPRVGQQTLLRFFASGPLDPEPLAARQVVYRSPPLPPGTVFSLMTDLALSQDTRLSVLIVPESGQADEAALLALPTLPRDSNHQRGTFPEAVRALTLTPDALPARVTFGADAMRGTDALTGDEQRLSGNFGLTYDLRLTVPPGTRLAVVPRGGPYRGAALLQDGAGPEQPLLIGRGAALKDYAAPAPLWTAQEGTVRLQLVPSAGSWLPLALVLYPR